MLLPYTSYDLSFYAKGNKPFAYKIIDETGAELLEQKQFTSSDSWQKCISSFTTGAHVGVKIVFSDMPGNGVSFIDDIVFGN